MGPPVVQGVDGRHVQAGAVPVVVVVHEQEGFPPSVAVVVRHSPFCSSSGGWLES